MKTVSFRKPIMEDFPILEEWIAADQDHSAIGMKPDFFTDTPNLALVAEVNGHPGIFMRLDPEDAGTIRLHFQFGTNRVTSAATLLRGWPIFLERVKASGKVSRLIFESISPSLIDFCIKAFDFSPVEGTNDYELFLTKEN